jgi:hypothetical protein
LLNERVGARNPVALFAAGAVEQFDQWCVGGADSVRLSGSRVPDALGDALDADQRPARVGGEGGLDGPGVAGDGGDCRGAGPVERPDAQIMVVVGGDQREPGCAGVGGAV